MKVVFNLNSKQKAIALAIAKEVAVRYAAEFSTDPADSWVELSGNLCLTTDHGYGVRTQRLHVEDSRLTYEGGRTTLKAGIGGCYNTILRIFGFEGKGVFKDEREAEEVARAWATNALDSNWCESTQPYIPWHMTEREAIESGIVSESRLREILTIQNRDSHTYQAAQNRLAELHPAEFKPFDPYWWRNEAPTDDFVEVNEET